MYVAMCYWRVTSDSCRIAVSRHYGIMDAVCQELISSFSLCCSLVGVWNSLANQCSSDYNCLEMHAVFPTYYRLCPMKLSGNAKNSQGLNNNDCNSIIEYFNVQNNVI